MKRTKDQQIALLRRRVREFRWHLGRMAKQKIVERDECAWLLKSDSAIAKGGAS